MNTLAAPGSRWIRSGTPPYTFAALAVHASARARIVLGVSLSRHSRRACFPALLALCAALVTPAEALVRTARIGFLLDGAWDRNAELLAMVQSEIRELVGAEHELGFPATKSLEADWMPSGVRRQIQQCLDDLEVDLVIALGVLASDQACRLPEASKPRVNPVVIGPEDQGLPQSHGASGIRNLANLAVPPAFGREMRAFRDLVPFQRLTILLNHHISDAVPDLHQHVRELASKTDIQVSIVPVRASAAGGLAELPPGP
jgi:hypothetical protein